MLLGLASDNLETLCGKLHPPHAQTRLLHRLDGAGDIGLREASSAGHSLKYFPGTHRVKGPMTSVAPQTLHIRPRRVERLSALPC